VLNDNPPQPISTHPNPPAYRLRISTIREQSLDPLTSRRFDNPGATKDQDSNLRLVAMRLRVLEFSHLVP
jgi:hypothetical protein